MGNGVLSTRVLLGFAVRKLSTIRIIIYMYLRSLIVLHYKLLILLESMPIPAELSPRPKSLLSADSSEAYSGRAPRLALGWLQV